MSDAPAQKLPSKRPVEKSATAFRTISEVSAELDVPTHVLRFWESKFSQVKPLKRGGGRRYYRPEDIDLLLKIRNLLYSDGYTIKGVQKLLRENGGKQAEKPARMDPSSVLADRREIVITESKRRELVELMHKLEGLRDTLRAV